MSKDVKLSNNWTIRRFTKKNKLTWGSCILTSILMSQVKVIKIGHKYILSTFWGVLVAIICDIKIDVIVCELHCVKIFFVNLLHSQAVWLFDTWHTYASHLVVDVFIEFSKYIHWICEYLPGGCWGWIYCTYFCLKAVTLGGINQFVFLKIVKFCEKVLEHQNERFISDLVKFIMIM